MKEKKEMKKKRKEILWPSQRSPQPRGQHPRRDHHHDNATKTHGGRGSPIQRKGEMDHDHDMGGHVAHQDPYSFSFHSTGRFTIKKKRETKRPHPLGGWIMKRMINAVDILVTEIKRKE